MYKYVVFTAKEKALAFAKESIEGNCQALLLGNPYTKAIKVAISIDDSDEEIMLESQINIYKERGFVKLNSNVEIKRDWFISDRCSADSLADKIEGYFTEDIIKINFDTYEIEDITNKKIDIPKNFVRASGYEIKYRDYKNEEQSMFIFCNSVEDIYDNSILPNLNFIIKQLDGRIINIDYEKHLGKFSNFISNDYTIPDYIDFRIILEYNYKIIAYPYDFKDMKRIDYNDILDGGKSK